MALIRVPFAGLTARQLAQVRAIYEASFRPEERDPWDDFVATAADPRCAVVAGLSEGEVIGFWAAARYEDPNLAYLAYLAVDPERRSQGAGAELFGWFEAAYADKVEGLFWEVEARDVPGDTPEHHAQTHRRVRFYERLGAAVVPGGRIEVPNADESGVEVVELLWKPMPGGPSVTDAALRDTLVRALLLMGYELTPDHPLVRKGLCRPN
ncbi:MAG: GNAT family N-acetyltransferase [Dehalococcoidia bacterium]